MTDIFFSYSAKDRERVRPIYEALTAVGFEIFWDLQIPAGKDWDTFIREQLTSARSAIVFWSFASIASDNVRHEATVAKQQGKLVPVLLDPLRVEQFPMGLFNTQAARLNEWSGNGDDPEWKKLLSEIETKAMPAWAGRRMENLAAELRAESYRRETAEAKEDSAETQLKQENQKQGQLRRDRNDAQAEAKTALAELAEVQGALDATKVHNSDMARRLASAESLAASARKRFPAWALLIGIILALGVGASVAYFQQEAVWTDQQARAVRETRTKVETDAREKAEETAKRVEAETRLKEAELRKTVEAETRKKVEAERQETEQRLLAEAREAQAALEAALKQAQLGFLARQQAERDEAIVKERKQRKPRMNVALSGTIIFPNPNVGNVEGCRDACLSRPECKGYEFRGTTCWNYSTIESQISNDMSTSDRWD